MHSFCIQIINLRVAFSVIVFNASAEDVFYDGLFITGLVSLPPLVPPGYKAVQNERYYKAEHRKSI